MLQIEKRRLIGVKIFKIVKIIKKLEEIALDAKDAFLIALVPVPLAVIRRK